MENITSEQFKFFLNELSAHIHNKIDTLKCPYEIYESEWFDEDGWKGQPFCDVSFTKDYYGEVDSECSGECSECWIMYTLEELGIEYDPKTLFTS